MAESINVPPTTTPIPPQDTSTGTSQDTKMLVTVLLLVFLYPIGVIVMWLWTQWKTWVKILVSVPFAMGAIAVILLITGIPILLLAFPGNIHVKNTTQTSLATNGSKCDFDSDCQSGKCTFGSNSVCTDGNIGSACNMDLDCNTGLSCSSNKCQTEGDVEKPTIQSNTPTPSVKSSTSITPTQANTPGITSTTENGIPYDVVVGTFDKLSNNSFTLKTVDQYKSPKTVTVLYEPDITFTNKNGTPLNPTAYVAGDTVRVYANTMRAEKYQASRVQNLSR